MSPLRLTMVNLDVFEGECDHPFSFFYLSSEDCQAHSTDWRSGCWNSIGSCWASKTSHHSHQRHKWRGLLVNGWTARKVARVWQKRNQQLDIKEIGWAQGRGNLNPSIHRRETSWGVEPQSMDINILNFLRRGCWQSSLTNSNAGLWHAAIRPRIFTAELLPPTWIPQCFASSSPGELRQQTTRWHHWT